MEESSATAEPIASAAAPLITWYENVYCGDVQGRLEVTEQGIFFRPSTPTPPIPATPYEIPWRDTTYRDFLQTQFKASVSSYATEGTLFQFKVGVLPSKEVTFSLHRQDEWERLQCDLEARGYGPPMAAEEESNIEDAQDDAHYSAEHDDAEAVGNEVEREEEVEEGEEHDASQGEEHHASQGEEHHASQGEQPYSTQGNEEPDHNSDQDRSHTENQAQEAEWEEEQEEDNIDDEEEGEENDEESYSNVGWSAGEDASANPNSSYYPVYHHGSVGTLVLSNSHLQFVPDRHSEPIKSLPWASLAGDPVFSPFNYPQALMTVKYHTTRGPHKKAGFDLDHNHDELGHLQEEVFERIRPWRDAPRERVHVPPKAKTNNANLSAGFKLHQKSPLFPARSEYSQTDDDSSHFIGGTSESTVSAVPLVGRKVPFHRREEPPRRMLMLFCAVCCLVTIAILTSMVIIGYFFGPRKAKEGQYIRTKSPYTINRSYLGTEPPTPAPIIESWSSGLASMSRAPATEEEGYEDNGGMPQRGEDFSITVANGTSFNATDSPQRSEDFSIMVASGTSFNLSSSEPTSGALTLSPSTPIPTSAHSRSEETVLNLLLDNSPDGGEAIRTTGTPQQAAYLLIRISDVEEEATSDFMIEQKFSLATFYYATNGDEWTDGADEWVDLASSDCDKPHLDCAEFTGMVTGINMPGNKMHVTLPPEIGMLKYLTHLNLKNNDLRGSLPTELGLLTNLQTLDVSGNPSLQGSIPEEVRALPSLQEITADLP